MLNHDDKSNADLKAELANLFSVEGTRTLLWARLMSMSMQDLCRISIFASFCEAGVSCIPIATDGSKKTLLKSWSDFQSRIPNKVDITNFHRNHGFDVGIAIIGGGVSGGLEILDFDDGSYFSPWMQLVEPIASRLPIIQTPSGGNHVMYRCCEGMGNHKIAMRVEGEKQKVIIETRGHHGYAVTVGSPATCHKSNKPYVQAAGPLLPDIPRISPEERRELWIAARSFDQRPPHEELYINRMKEIKQKSSKVELDSNEDFTKPWNDFNANGCWREILEPHGWQSKNGIEV